MSAADMNTKLRSALESWISEKQSAVLYRVIAEV